MTHQAQKHKDNDDDNNNNNNKNNNNAPIRIRGDFFRFSGLIWKSILPGGRGCLRGNVSPPFDPHDFVSLLLLPLLLRMILCALLLIHILSSEM